MLWLILLCMALVIIIIFLIYKIYLMRRSASEIRAAFEEKLEQDTNTLISISSHDAPMRQLAASINKQLKTLRCQRQRYQQGDLELKEAVTNISHDLRTPLTAICGYLELIEGEKDPSVIQHYFDIIKDRTVVLSRLTEELFRYSYFMTISQELSYETVSLNRALEENISAYYASLKGCGIVPKITMPQEDVVRQLNKDALSRILGNIMSNAIKYSDGDLQITLLNTGEIIFTNHASALDETAVGQLFDRFYTVDTAAKSTGLGLSIAKVLTDQMGGSITASYCNSKLNIHVSFH